MNLRLPACILDIIICCCLAAAQQTSAPPQESQNEKQIEKQEQSERMLKVIPIFETTNRRNATPLTAGQKFRLMAKQALDPFEYVAAGLQAGLGQATNEFAQYGQGAAGYGKRYGATLADQASSQFFYNFFYPALLKEDPRYFRLGEGTAKHRIAYALAQQFVCHTDSGDRSFNWSTTLGSLTSGGISNIYYPPADRGFGLTMSRAAIAMGYGSAGGLILEFWPDIDRKFFHKKPKTGTEPVTSSPSPPPKQP